MTNHRRSLVTIALGLGVVGTASCSHQPRQPLVYPEPRTTEPDTGRPKIILLHGRAQEFRVGQSLQDEWLGALRDGLLKLGLWGTITTDDIAFVSYNDLFEPGALLPARCVASELTPEVFAKRPAGSWSLFRDPFEKRYRPVTIRLRNRLARTLPSPKIAVGALGDVETYFTPNGGIACAVNDRLEQTLLKARRERRGIVLAAHSLGSLVSYRTLSAAAADSNAIPVSRLVTFGSQLPYRGLMESFLGDSGVHAFPPGVRHWVNVVGLGDLAAFAARDESAFQRERDRLTEVHVATDPDDRHSATAYLKNPITALAIARGWCNAFPPDSVASGEPVRNAVRDKCNRLRYWLARDVHDALTPQRYPSDPLATLIARGGGTSRGKKQDGAIAGAGSIALYAPALELLRYVPTELVLEQGKTESGRYTWRLSGVNSLRSFNSISPYVLFGGGHVAAVTREPASVASAGVGIRTPMPYPYNGFGLGLFGEVRADFTLQRHAESTSRMGTYARVGFYLDLGKYVGLFTNILHTADPAAFTDKDDFLSSSRSCDESAFRPDSLVCVRAFRLYADVRRDVSVVARTKQAASADLVALDSLKHVRPWLRDRKIASSDVFDLADEAAYASGTDLDGILAAISAVRPDLVQLPLSVARMIRQPILQRLGDNRAFDNVAIVVDIGVDFPELRAECETLNVTACVVGRREWYPARAAALNVVRQRRRATPAELLPKKKSRTAGRDVLRRDLVEVEEAERRRLTPRPPAIPNE